MDKTQIQFPRYRINKPKHEAIPIMEAYVNNNIGEFIDGEEITIRYIGTDGNMRSVNAVVNIDNGQATVSVEISETDTVKIIESAGTEGIEDKESLWLSDNWDDEVASIYPASDVRGTVRQMAVELKFVREQLALCVEALTNTLGGGDIITNSEKNELENMYDPEEPIDAPQIYTTGDTEIYEWDVYIGGADLSKYSTGGLYRFQNYYPKVRAFNSAGEEIEITSAITVEMSVGGGSATVDFNGKKMYAETSGDTTFTATIHDYEHGFVETKSYLIIFEKNEKPDYPSYNVKHLLVKHADSEEIMFANANYLLVGEFCWCINEQSLYLKEKAKNGTIQLFKINGQGSVTPTGDTTAITYYIDDEEVLNIEASDGYTVRVDEDGYLILIGEIDENGILILNDTETDGPDTGSTIPTGSTETVLVNIDRNGILNFTTMNGNSIIDKNGYLVLSGNVDKNGILDITNT